MKQTTFWVLALFVALLALPTTSSAQVEPDAVYGLCVDMDTWCDDYFFTATSVSDDTYSLTGYNYGCPGFLNTLASGSLRVDGGVLYMAVTGGSNEGEADTTIDMTLNYEIPYGVFTGTVDYLFTYVYLGILSGHGGGDGASLSVCADPGLATESLEPSVLVPKIRY